MEVGAGTFHPATTLRALGPDKTWKGSLCAALAAADRWALWGKPKPTTALLSVSDHYETVTV